MFLDECKYFVIEKKMPEFTTDNIKNFSDDFNREDSDEEILMKKNSDQENFTEEN